MFRGVALSFVVTAATLFGAAHADAAVFYPVTNDISGVQNGGPTVTGLGNGENLWATSITWTNNGSTALTNVYFVNDGAALNGGIAQWDNTAQEWIDGSFVASAYNSSLSIELAPSITNISIPSGFGLATGDDVPAFLIASYLAPGASITTDTDFELTSNITGFSFNGAVVGTPAPVPEPASLALFGTALAGLGLMRRRKRA